MNYILGGSLRVISLAGKFLFLAFAADHMTPDEFGRVGIVMAISLIVIGVSGLEGYQTLLRKISQSDDDVSAESRSFYCYFSVFGSCLSLLISIFVFAVYGWSADFVVLCGLVVAVDHLNIELCRVLIAEGKSVLSIGTLAMRTGSWALAIPLLYYMNVTDGVVSAQYVVSCWGVASGIGLLSFYAIRGRYKFKQFQKNNFKFQLLLIAKSAPRWVAVVVSWRFLESGARVLAGLLVSEAAAGKITLLSTVASFSLVAVKSIIEPVYFSKILKSGQDGEAALKSFSRLVLYAAPLLGLGACLALLVYVHVVSRFTFYFLDYIVFSIINFAYIFMCFSQVDHFKLYRIGSDGALLSSALISFLVMLCTGIPLGLAYGEIGIVVGAFLGSIVLFISKRKYSLMLS